MDNVIQIIKELEQTSSTNGKLGILKRESNNELFLRMLYYTYSDHLQYGFSEKKLRELLLTIESYESVWDNVFDMLDKLSISNINDVLRRQVIAFLTIQPEETRELYIKILTKDLRCGISSKSINKAIKGLIKVWDIQQAYSIDKVKLKKNEWIALSLKMNGIRSSFFNNEFRSRQNKVMKSYEHIIEDLKALNINHLFVDGEMVRKNIDNVSDNENFRLTTSIVNSDESDKTQIKLVIFDIITKEDFSVGESQLTFKDRLEQLNQLKSKIEELKLENIEIAPTYYTGTDHSMIETLLDKVDSEGYEGLMCIRNMPYKTKRNNGILKCKKFLEVDLEIVGYEEGEGRLKGILGAFVVDYKGTMVNVGSGYSDEERRQYWENRDALLGRILQVRYKEESMDRKTGKVSMQFPTKVCVREEGKEVSYN